MKPSLPEIILGSRSPRRKELLAGLGLHFSVQTIDTDESWPSGLSAESISEYLAVKKAQPLAQYFPKSLIITADTIVDLDGNILNKPENEEDAVRMLELLSGRTHRVHTGVCLQSGTEVISFTETTRVTFRKLEMPLIQAYVRCGKPLDKAGGYGIQEWIGMTGIDGIDGDFYNVMGLPVARMYHILLETYDFSPALPV